MSVDWVGYGYATLVASGGVIGYVKAGMCWIRVLIVSFNLFAHFYKSSLLNAVLQQCSCSNFSGFLLSSPVDRCGFCLFCQAVFPPWLLGFSLGALLVLEPTKSQMTLKIFGCP